MVESTPTTATTCRRDRESSRHVLAPWLHPSHPELRMSLSVSRNELRPLVLIPSHPELRMSFSVSRNKQRRLILINACLPILRPVLFFGLFLAQHVGAIGKVVGTFLNFGCTLAPRCECPFPSLEMSFVHLSSSLILIPDFAKSITCRPQHFSITKATIIHSMQLPNTPTRPQLPDTILFLYREGRKQLPPIRNTNPTSNSIVAVRELSLVSP